MEDVKCLYGACVKFPQVAGDIEFKYSAMEVVKVNDDETLQTRYPYFISRSYSTKFFDKSMLDKEFEVTESLTVFYSKDKQKCVDWLNKRRNELIESYRYNYERLAKSEVKETTDSD